MYLLLSAFCILILEINAREDLPTYIHVCQRNDPNLEQCITNSINHIRPYLRKGIPELDIPGIEPFDMGEVITSERTETSGIKISARNFRTYNTLDFKIRNLVVHEEGKLYEFEILVPRVDFEGEYEVDGQFLLFPLKGVGQVFGNFTNCSGKAKMYFEKTIINGEHHILVKKVDVKPKIGKGNLLLTNLFNGEKTLNRAINEVINQNLDVLSVEITPLLERPLQKLFKRVTNGVFKKFSYDQLFPL